MTQNIEKYNHNLKISVKKSSSITSIIRHYQSHITKGTNLKEDHIF